VIHRKATKRKIRFAKRLRRRQTKAERRFGKIAKALKSETGIRFWSQVVLLGWIVDFWSPKLKLVVEIDGATHDGREDYDKHRASVMEDELDALTVRFTNFEVITNPAMVKARLKEIVFARQTELLCG
jgi:very-short-patch-repair endonuclease